MKKRITFHLILVVSTFALMFSCRKNELSQSAQQRSKPPVANAGDDQTITFPLDSVVLDGSNSFDPVGTIVSYHWRTLSSTFTPTIKQDTSKVTTVHFSHTGTYYFELTVRNSLLGTSKDTCKVIVQQSPAFNPSLSLSVDIVNYDTILNLPVNSISFKAIAYLNGSGPMPPAPVLKSVEWKKIAGPPNFLILSADKLTPIITNLAQGMYAFECTITDLAGRTASGTTVVRVSNTAAVEQELVIQKVKWNEGNGFWVPTLELNLDSIIPVNKSIKKVLIKTACETVYTEALPLWLWNNHNYSYFLQYYNNQFWIIIDNWSSCQNGTADIKIIYS